MPSLDGHIVHGEAVRSLRKDHFSFWTEDRFELQLISNLKSSKSETSHSFWAAKEHNRYLPYFMAEHTLEQRLRVLEAYDLVWKAEGRSAGSTSTTISLKQASAKKKGYSITPKVKFGRKGTVASASLSYDIGDKESWSSIYVQGTAMLLRLFFIT